MKMFPQIDDQHIVNGNLYRIVSAYRCDGCPFLDTDGMCRVPDDIVRKYNTHRCDGIRYKLVGKQVIKL